MFHRLATFVYVGKKIKMKCRYPVKDDSRMFIQHQSARHMAYVYLNRVYIELSAYIICTEHRIKTTLSVYCYEAIIYAILFQYS